jgi:hypothetical protein
MENRLRSALEQLRRRRKAADRAEKAQRRAAAKAVHRRHRTFDEGRDGGTSPGV